MLYVALMVLLFLCSGGALVAALIMSRRRRLDLERRVDLASAAPEMQGRAIDVWLKARAPEFDTQLRRAFTFGGGQIWGMTSGAVRLLTLAAGAGGVTWLLSYVAFDWPAWLAAPVTLAAAFMLPRITLQRQQKQAERAFTDLFPDAVVAIARMLRAGLPISTAVRAISAESPPPVSTVFATISDQVEIGTPIEVALENSSLQVGLPDYRFFTVAVVLQHVTGGNLAVTLEILSDIIRRRRAVRLKARATTAEIRVSAYVLGSLPFLIVGALLLIQPGYLSPLVSDPRGHVILIMAAGGMVLAGLTMRQMMRSVTNI
jgi:tight adherence protein B